MSIYKRSHTEKFEAPLLIIFNDQYKKLKNGVEFVFCPDSTQLDEEDWSNNYNDYTNEKKLEDAAQILRNEIMNEFKPSIFDLPTTQKKDRQ